MQYAQELIERQAHEEAASDENMPMTMKQLQMIFDEIKSEALEFFTEPLQMAQNKLERDMIEQKMQ